jgi:hypothetical protein
MNRNVCASRNCTICVRNTSSSFSSGRIIVPSEGTYAESVNLRVLNGWIGKPISESGDNPPLGVSVWYGESRSMTGSSIPSTSTNCVR